LTQLRRKSTRAKRFLLRTSLSNLVAKNRAINTWTISIRPETGLRTEPTGIILVNWTSRTPRRKSWRRF
jgi:hypothetical protein